MDLIKSRADLAGRTPLAGQRAAWANAQADRGAVPAALELSHLSLTLRRSPERQQAFDRLLEEQQDAASPNYQRWLSPSEIGARFGASQHDIDVLTEWLRAQGLSVDTVANSRMRIGFSGSAAAVAAAFDTDLHYFRAGPQTRIANTREPRIPTAFAGAVQSVVGLTAIVFKPNHHVGPPQNSARPKNAPYPAATSCPPGGAACSHTLFPADFATIYNVDPVHRQGIDGSGQSIGIIARARVYDPDIQNFQARSGLATKYPTVVIPTGGVDPGPAASTCSPTGTPSCSHPSERVADQTEATLDVQRATSVAPGAEVKLITSGTKNSVDGVYIAMDYAIDTDPVPAKVLSISYSTCEADNTRDAAAVFDSYFSQAAMEGISVFVSSGDGGVDGCASLDQPPPAVQRASTNLLCSSGHVTCVGGTEFADVSDPELYWSADNGTGYGSALGYIPEGAWNEPLDPDGKPQMAATGGGVSTFIAKPAWQVGIGVPGNQGRYTPDVSFNASTREGYFTCVAAQGGSCAIRQGSFTFLVSGGTSASAPSMAGITALLNQKTGAAQANLNPRLYALAANPANGVFHDVTTGSSGVANCTLANPSPCNNSTPGPTGLGGGLKGYAVGTGYDLPTGLGSIDVTQLLAQWDRPQAGAVNLDQHGVTGTWANLATSGQGLVMEVYPDFFGAGRGQLFGGWFTYDTSVAGGLRWYTIQGEVAAGSPSAAMPIYQSLGGRFDAPQATTLTTVGQATLSLSDCMHGTLAYAFSDGSGRSGSIPISRLLSNITCSPSGDNGAAASSYLWAGTWADPADDGQGIVLDIDPKQGNLFAAWYTYAANAAPGSGASAQRWYTLQSTIATGAHRVDNVAIYTTRNGVFDRPDPTTTTQVGHASLAFNNCASITLTFAFTAGENAGKEDVLALQRVGPTPAGCQP